MVTIASVGPNEAWDSFWVHLSALINFYDIKTSTFTYDGNSSEEMFADPLDLDFDQLSIGEDLPDWTVQEELDYNYEQLPMPRRYG